MEDHVLACLNTLKCSNLPATAELFKYSNIVELQPTTSRLCLLNLKEEMSKVNSDHKQAQEGMLFADQWLANGVISSL